MDDSMAVDRIAQESTDRRGRPRLPLANINCSPSLLACVALFVTVMTNKIAEKNLPPQLDLVDRACVDRIG